MVRHTNCLQIQKPHRPSLHISEWGSKLLFQIFARPSQIGYLLCTCNHQFPITGLEFPNDQRAGAGGHCGGYLWIGNKFSSCCPLFWGPLAIKCGTILTCERAAYWLIRKRGGKRGLVVSGHRQESDPTTAGCTLRAQILHPTFRSSFYAVSDCGDRGSVEFNKPDPVDGNLFLLRLAGSSSDRGFRTFLLRLWEGSNWEECTNVSSDTFSPSLSISISSTGSARIRW